jgi:hypothetical protein
MKNTAMSSAMAATFLMVIALFGIPSAAMGQNTSQHWIYGAVTTPDGQPLPGVTMQFSGGLPAQVTDPNGKYSVPAAADLDQYTVTPSKAGYEFASKQKAALILLDHAEVNFVATASKSTAVLAPESAGAAALASPAVAATKATVAYVTAPPPPAAPTVFAAALAATNQPPGGSTGIVSKVSKPSISPYSMSTTTPVTVYITCSTAGATIRYTTNGVAPTSISTIYRSPFTLSSSATVLAKAFKSGMKDSDVASASYQIVRKVATPVISPGTTNFSSYVMVTMTCATGGATIRYTTNGATPTASSPIYTVPIKVLKTTTVKACAFRSGMTNSDVVSATYTVPSKYITFPRSYHPSLRNPVSAQNLFNQGTAVLLKDDDGDGNGDVNDDVPLSVRIYVPNAAKATFPNQASSSFPASERYNYTLPIYNDVPNSTVAIQILAAKFAVVKQVNSLPGRNGVTAPSLNRASMILAPTALPVTSVHEWGHLCGLPDYYGAGDKLRIMYGIGISGRCEINVSQRAAMLAY